jgi:hypothetical protein
LPVMISSNWYTSPKIGLMEKTNLSRKVISKSEPSAPNSSSKGSSQTKKVVSS